MNERSSHRAAEAVRFMLVAIAGPSNVIDGRWSALAVSERPGRPFLHDNRGFLLAPLPITFCTRPALISKP